jgi:hypothetical protein
MSVGPNVIDDCEGMTEEEYWRGMAEADERWKVPPCLECGAETPEQSETLCNCAGDKDHCHGCELWPD